MFCNLVKEFWLTELFCLTCKCQRKRIVVSDSSQWKVEMWLRLFRNQANCKGLGGICVLEKSRNLDFSLVKRNIMQTVHIKLIFSSSHILKIKQVSGIFYLTHHIQNIILTCNQQNSRSNIYLQPISICNGCLSVNMASSYYIQQVYILYTFTDIHSY